MPHFSESGALMFPMSSLPYILERKETDLLGTFYYDYIVKSGWIRYNPNKVTVLSCNEMFQPMYVIPSMYNVRKQLLKVKTSEDLHEFRAMFRKPLVLCVTRRQECEAMINGFDTDFLIFVDPKHPSVAQKLCALTQFVEKKIKDGRRFCVTVDFTEMLEELSPDVFRKHVMWLNCSFCVTNYCRPNSFLDLNIPIMWCAMFPGYLFASLPYRAYRKCCCEDKHLQIRFPLKFQACPKSFLLLQFFSVEHPKPGMYLKYEKLFIARLCGPAVINSLISLPAKRGDASAAEFVDMLVS